MAMDELTFKIPHKPKDGKYGRVHNTHEEEIRLMNNQLHRAWKLIEELKKEIEELKKASG
tara:strand:+ start:838 stop:1017 length:180 start_codon:yes stop_codon:yes gene_type:complete